MHDINCHMTLIVSFHKESVYVGVLVGSPYASVLSVVLPSLLSLWAGEGGGLGWVDRWGSWVGVVPGALWPRWEAPLAAVLYRDTENLRVSHILSLTHSLSYDTFSSES